MAGYLIAGYVRRDNGDENPRYDFECRRTVSVRNEDELERKLVRDNRLWSDGRDYVTVAYERMEGCRSYEGNSYAVVAYEHINGVSPTFWRDEEIAEEISVW